MRSALSCDGVRVRYGGIEVLHDVRLALAYGTVSALVGPNGAGKTTLLDWLAGASTETSSLAGDLYIGGTVATHWPPARRAQAGLRYVPFERNVFLGLSVLDNLRATAGAAATDSAFSCFPVLGRLAARPAGVLSGGERQLLAVACALWGRGRILLLDEPTHGLAPALVDRVLEELARTAREDDRAVLIADPQPEKAAEYADFRWPLERGLRLPAVGA